MNGAKSMTSKKISCGVLGALALSVVLISGSGASATAANSPELSSAGVTTWIVPQTQQGGNYWTAERMKAATPGDALVANRSSAAVKAAQSQPVTGGKSVSVPGQPAAKKAIPAATQESTVSHIGKVFFTLGGTDYVCSGNAIAATNRSTVATAGHCVNEGPGAFATRWVFVPAYQNGTAPYGQWTATALTAPTRWTSGGDISYDTGFARVAPVNGTYLSNIVGASGVSFNQARGLTYKAFGYPAAAPFTGATLQSCSGTAQPDPYGQSQSQGIPCDMTGGSSGGPWFIGSSSGGSQNSVNSFGYTSVPNTMFGPYWGSVIQSTYSSAAA
jgi:hypothetical protein